MYSRRPHLPQLWEMTLRAMDDIKETVRLAAQRAGRSLAAASTKMCDYGGGASPAEGAAACAICVPYLLKQGMSAEAEEVHFSTF